MQLLTDGAQAEGLEGIGAVLVLLRRKEDRIKGCFLAIPFIGDIEGPGGVFDAFDLGLRAISDIDLDGIGSQVHGRVVEAGRKDVVDRCSACSFLVFQEACDRLLILLGREGQCLDEGSVFCPDSLIDLIEADDPVSGAKPGIIEDIALLDLDGIGGIVIDRLGEAGIGDEEEDIGDKEVHGDAGEHDSNLLEVVDASEGPFLGDLGKGDVFRLLVLACHGDIAAKGNAADSVFRLAGDAVDSFRQRLEKRRGVLPSFPVGLASVEEAVLIDGRAETDRILEAIDVAEFGDDKVAKFMETDQNAQSHDEDQNINDDHGFSPLLSVHRFLDDGIGDGG